MVAVHLELERVARHRCLARDRQPGAAGHGVHSRVVRGQGDRDGAGRRVRVVDLRVLDGPRAAARGGRAVRGAVAKVPDIGHGRGPHLHRDVEEDEVDIADRGVCPERRPPIRHRPGIGPGVERRGRDLEGLEVLLRDHRGRCGLPAATAGPAALVVGIELRADLDALTRGRKIHALASAGWTCRPATAATRSAAASTTAAIGASPVGAASTRLRSTAFRAPRTRIALLPLATSACVVSKVAIGIESECDIWNLRNRKYCRYQQDQC